MFTQLFLKLVLRIVGVIKVSWGLPNFFREVSSQNAISDVFRIMVASFNALQVFALSIHRFHKNVGKLVVSFFLAAAHHVPCTFTKDSADVALIFKKGANKEI